MVGPNPDPLNIFVVADQFRATASLSLVIPNVASVIATVIPELHSASRLYLPTSYMVCKAFALELYFKCLIRIGGRSYGREHDLKKLFRLIRLAHRSEIERRWQVNADALRSEVHGMYAADGRPLPKVDLNFVLTTSKDAFSIMRYAFEGIPPDTGWLADTILEAARDTILAMYSDWERKQQVFPAPAIRFPATSPIR
jgi:HEPN domain-containing protein